MANIPEFTEDLKIISQLSDEPNDTDGLTAEALKAKFDEGPGKLKAYINETLLPQLSDILDELDDALDRLASLSGCRKVTAISENDDDDDLPSSPAVQSALQALHTTVSGEIEAAMGEAGQGDMARITYDQHGNERDIFDYADDIGTALRNLYRSIESRFDSTTGVLAQQYGGTGADTKADGRGNLGITSGTADPSGGEDGDIYVKYV